MTTTSSNPHLLPVCPKKPQKGNNETDDEPSLNEPMHESLILNFKRIFIRIMVFSKPGWSKILIFFGLMIIAVGGVIQSWGFSDQDMFGYPPPPFYELIRPFPFWLVWIITLVPLAIPSSILTILFSYNADFIFGGHIPYWIFIMNITIYYYFLSCLIISFLDYKRKVDSGETQPGRIYFWILSWKIFYQNEKYFNRTIVLIGICVTILAIIGHQFIPGLIMVSYFSSLYLFAFLIWTLWQQATKNNSGREIKTL